MIHWFSAALMNCKLLEDGFVVEKYDHDRQCLFMSKNDWNKEYFI